MIKIIIKYLKLTFCENQQDLLSPDEYIQWFITAVVKIISSYSLSCDTLLLSIKLQYSRYKHNANENPFLCLLHFSVFGSQTPEFAANRISNRLLDVWFLNSVELYRTPKQPRFPLYIGRTEAPIQLGFEALLKRKRYLQGESKVCIYLVKSLLDKIGIFQDTFLGKSSSHSLNFSHLSENEIFWG